MTPGWIVAAFLIYTLAHLGRSFKYWLIYGDSDLSFRWTFVIFQVTAVAGYWMPVVFSEILRLTMLYGLQRNLTRSVAAELLSRSLDLVWLGFLLSLSAGTSRYGLISLAVGGFLIFAFYSLNQLIRPLKVALLSRAHNGLNVSLLRVVDTFGRVGRDITKGSYSVLGLGLLLTVTIWILDAVALSFALPADHPLGGGVFQSLHTWAMFSVQALFGLNLSFSLEQWSLLKERVFVPQLILAALLLTIFTASWALRRKGTR